MTSQIACHSIEPSVKTNDAIHIDMPILFEKAPPVFLAQHPMLDTPEKRRAVFTGYQERRIEKVRLDQRL